MPSLIEGLTTGAEAEDQREQKRERIRRRYFPNSPQELFDALAELGPDASFTSLIRSISLGQAEPHGVIAAFLGRWPTLEELRALPTPYDPRAHFADIIHGHEFRRHLCQRILTTYPDKRRLLFVQVPHCDGAHFLHIVSTSHPVFPGHLTAERLPRDYFGALCLFLNKLPYARTVMVTLPTLAPFWTPSLAPTAATDPLTFAQPPVDPAGHVPLSWTLRRPAYRPSDRLFAIVRNPEDIILAEVNRIAAALAGPADLDDPLTRRWRARFDAMLAACDPADLRPLAQRILAVLPDRDPLCHALGDGTCTGALDACTRTGIEIVDVANIDAWLGKTWNKKAELSADPPRVILKREDLAHRDLQRLSDLTEHDRPLYARILASGKQGLLF